MNTEDPFERDVRAALADLASEPAPEHLVERVAGIPAREPVRRRSLLRLSLGLASAAAVLLVAVAAVLIARPGAGPLTGGVPLASPTPVATSALSSEGPVGTVPATTPSPTPTSTPVAMPQGGPIGGPVPAGFQPGSITFTSPDVGWVLGTAPCPAEPCTSIARTLDGGRSWVGIPAPRAPYVAAPQGSDPAGVSGLRMADPLNGWAFGPDLWSTHDGGGSWQKVALPGLAAGSEVWALETAGGLVHAAVYDGDSHVRIASSPVASDEWQLAPVQLEVGAGPVPSAQMVLQGDGGWVIEVDRTVVGGARLVNGAWTAWQPPCLDVAGPAVLAARGSADLVAACDVGQWSTPEGERLYLSSDGGLTFARVGGQVPLQQVQGLTSLDAGVTLVAGNPAGGGVRLAATFDGGRSWTTVFDAPDGSTVAYLGLTTRTQGVAIVTTADDRRALVITRDGGRTWPPVAFGG